MALIFRWFAYINGEVLEYSEATGTTITVAHRGYASQKDHATDSKIVDITDTNIYSENIKGNTNTSGQITYSNYVGDNMLNDIAMVADSPAWTQQTHTAGNLSIGIEYTIATVGTTDFTLIGAANNNVGTVFTATNIGAGTGTVTTLALVKMPHNNYFNSRNR